MQERGPTEKPGGCMSVKLAGFYELAKEPHAFNVQEVK
jgi:hypothetical protein